MRKAVKRLSSYELSCGNCQVRSTVTHGVCDVTTTTLFKEHSVYHVRTHTHNELGRRAWESFATLKEAQKEFTRQSRQYH